MLLRLIISLRFPVTGVTILLRAWMDYTVNLRSRG